MQGAELAALIAGAAQGTPTFVFALHLPLVASCRLFGVSTTSFMKGRKFGCNLSFDLGGNLP
jgi:hypothetical protein